MRETQIGLNGPSKQVRSCNESVTLLHDADSRKNFRGY